MHLNEGGNTVADIEFKTSEECRVELVAHTVMKTTETYFEQALGWVSPENPDAGSLPVSAARASFGKEDKTGEDEAADIKLMKYLADHQHMTPFEYNHATFLIECPLFIRSQIMRHRTFCLAGDNVISFNRPCDGKHYPYRMDRLYKNWSDPAQRPRLRNMRIRSICEETHEVVENRVVDVIYSGKKHVWSLVLETGEEFHGSEDHLIFTDQGWRTIAQLGQDRSVRVASCNPHKAAQIVCDWPEIDGPEVWRAVPGWEGAYDVSDRGRVRSWKTTRGALERPRIKKPTKNAQGYACVSLSSDGKSRMCNVHSLVMSAFHGKREDGMEVRHLNGNRLDASLENLAYGTPSENQRDRVVHGTAKRMGIDFCKIVDIVYRGFEPTYDIAVSAPNHNFFANGVVVHNSFNEISRRYTSEDIAFWKPDKWRKQSKSNKQASTDEGVDATLYYGENGKQGSSLPYEDSVEVALESYNWLLSKGCCREQARAVLPQSLLTRFYMGGSLRNFVHFLKLRLDPSAQYEVRVVAERITEKLRELWPVPMSVLLPEETTES